MKYTLLIVLSLVAISVQMVIDLPLFFQPSFPFLLAFTWGLAFGPAQGVAAAALNGLLLDVTSAAPLGSHLVATLIPSVLTILRIEGFFEKRLVEGLVLVPLATLVYYVSLALTFLATGRVVDWGDIVVWLWIPGIVANILWGFPLLLVTGKLAQRLVRLPSGGIAIRPIT
jgi:rod shape-determining protein MreD